MGANDPNAETGDEPDERIERTDVGASIEVALKRGTGTRDEDKPRLKAKGATVAETVEDFDELLTAYEERFAERVRNLQPERAEEDGEGEEE